MAPSGYSSLGDISKDNYRPLYYGEVFRDLTGDALRDPLYFSKIRTDIGSGADWDGSF